MGYFKCQFAGTLVLRERLRATPESLGLGFRPAVANGRRHHVAKGRLAAYRARYLLRGLFWTSVRRVLRAPGFRMVDSPQRVAVELAVCACLLGRVFLPPGGGEG